MMNNMAKYEDMTQRAKDKAAENITVNEENKKKALKHCWFGHLHMQTNAYELALDEFANAVACDPTLAKAHHNIGIVHRRQDREALALFHFVLAKEYAIKDNDPIIISHCLDEIASIYHQQKDNEKAIELTTEAISLCKDNPSLFRHRGNYYMATKQIDLAILDLKEAIRLDDNNIKARSMLGNCYHSLKEYDKAAAEYSKNIQIDPNASATSYYNLARIEAKNPDQIFNAINHYYWAAKLKPTFEEAKYELEKCLEGKSKNNIFVGIKTLPKSQQFQLLTDILNKKGPLGELFWEWRFLEDGFSSCSLGAGTLKDINTYYSSLKEDIQKQEKSQFKMAATIITRGFFKETSPINTKTFQFDKVQLIFGKVSEFVSPTESKAILDALQETYQPRKPQ